MQKFYYDCNGFTEHTDQKRLHIRCSLSLISLSAYELDLYSYKTINNINQYSTNTPATLYTECEHSKT